MRAIQLQEIAFYGIISHVEGAGRSLLYWFGRTGFWVLFVALLPVTFPAWWYLSRKSRALAAELSAVEVAVTSENYMDSLNFYKKISALKIRKQVALEMRTVNVFEPFSELLLAILRINDELERQLFPAQVTASRESIERAKAELAPFMDDLDDMDEYDLEFFNQHHDGLQQGSGSLD